MSLHGAQPSTVKVDHAMLMVWCPHGNRPLQPHDHLYARTTIVAAETVGDSLSELKDGLGEHTYSTKTRGERLQPAAQPAGDGTYVIAKGGSKNGIHLG